MNARAIGMVAAVFAYAVVVRAADQIWYDAGADNIWSTNALNWDAGVEWVNGNSAVFSGGGGTVAGEAVDVSNAVVVADFTFQTNGYVIADLDGNGTLTLAGSSNLVTVVNAGDTAKVSEVIAGSGGFIKAGDGVLQLTATNAYAGTTIVRKGLLRLNPNSLYALGVTGPGNDTVVENGATLDLNGCYAASGSSENFTVSGAGVDGRGVLVNKGADHVNKNVGSLTLLDNAVINSQRRIDAYTINGNGHTLTKIGAEQFCVQNLINAELIINEGVYTILSDNRAMGGTTPGDTIMNAGTLNAWNTVTISERITFNGGTIQQGNPSRQEFKLTGYLTLNSNMVVNTGSITSGVEIAGFMDGNGGFTQAGNGWCYITGDTNAYSGPTVINSGKSLGVGRTNVYSGVLGVGTVTNWGTLNGFSKRITDGRLVNNSGGVVNVYTGSLGAVYALNSGNLYVRGGELGTGTVVNGGGLYCLDRQLGSGAITNNGTLYFDYAGRTVSSNDFYGAGMVVVRYGCEAVFDQASSLNGILRLGDGSLTLTNGTALAVTNTVSLADRANIGFTYTSVTNVTSTLNIHDGTSLLARNIIMGEGGNVSTGRLAGTINQYGGTVTTFDYTAESNGIRMAHWPQGYGVYNMMGGVFTVENGWDLCIATDGTGWLRQTGGEIYASRVMLHERKDNTQGFGRLTVEGGVLNIGLTNGVLNVESNGIAVDGSATYLLEYGGAGGIVRAVTNFSSSLNATLYGTNGNAITFDTKEWEIRLSGKMSGAGGLNKAGLGVLTLAGQNSYSGTTWVAEGTLLLGVANALTNTLLSVAAGAALDLGGLSQKLGGVGGNGVVSNGTLMVGGLIAPGTNGVGTLTLDVGPAAPGGTLLVDVTTNGTSDVVHVVGDLDLAGMTLEVADTALLNTHEDYTIATYTGSLAGAFGANNLPNPWYVMYDRAGKRIQLRSENGTLLRVR